MTLRFLPAQNYINTFKSEKKHDFFPFRRRNKNNITYARKERIPFNGKKATLALNKFTPILVNFSTIYYSKYSMYVVVVNSAASAV
jgi:hypothetical protein